MTTLSKLKKEYALNLIRKEDSITWELVVMLDVLNYNEWYKDAVELDNDYAARLDRVEEITYKLECMIRDALSDAEHQSRRYINHTIPSGKHIIAHILEESKQMEPKILTRIKRAEKRAIKSILFDKHIEETCGWDVLSHEEQIEKRQNWMNS